MSRRRAFGGAREREKEEGGHGLGLPSDAGEGRWENAGERERNEKKRDFDFSSGEKVADHGEFVFQASPSSHDRECGCLTIIRNSA